MQTSVSENFVVCVWGGSGGGGGGVEKDSKSSIVFVSK